MRTTKANDLRQTPNAVNAAASVVGCELRSPVALVDGLEPNAIAAEGDERPRKVATWIDIFLGLGSLDWDLSKPNFLFNHLFGIDI